MLTRDLFAVANLLVLRQVSGVTRRSYEVALSTFRNLFPVVKVVM